MMRTRFRMAMPGAAMLAVAGQLLAGVAWFAFAVITMLLESKRDPVGVPRGCAVTAPPAAASS